MGRKVTATTAQKKEQKEQKNSKSESVQPKESDLVQQQQQYHPLDLEVDLDAEIRSKELSTIEEIKEYAVKLSNLTMQDLRVWNNNGTVWIHCKYNDVRHPKKVSPCGFFVKLHKERGSGLFSVKDCNLRHREHKRMEEPKPTHTQRAVQTSRNSKCPEGEANWEGNQRVP